jgi:hypothetical protein
MRRMDGDGGVGRARSRRRRDGNSGTEMIFYPRVALVPDPNRDGYFLPPADNSTGTRYFTTAIILGCEQVKICSFCYINYIMF